jgi:hypothetical protein
MVDQIVSVIGAILILAAYVGNQRGVLSSARATYHWMNFLGAVALTVVAFRAQQWGFVLLEGAWAAVSVPPLLWPRSRS